MTFRDFVARGGHWVVAQTLLLILALWIPLETGAKAPFDLRWLGAGLAALGLGVAAIAMLGLRQTLTPFPKPRDRGVLQTRGPYSVVRHPIYSGMILSSFGWSLHQASSEGLLLSLVLGVFFDRKATYEERWLVEKYPDYMEYRKRVRKLVPGVY